MHNSNNYVVEMFTFNWRKERNEAKFHLEKKTSECLIEKITVGM